MKQLSIVSVIVLFLSAALHASAQNPPDGCISYQVKKGESISLICIDCYGYYSAELGKAIQKLNPAIKNIDLVFPGQNIILRTAAQAAEKASFSTNADAAPSDLAQPDTLFIKHVNITQGVVTFVSGTVWQKPSMKSKRSLLKVNSVLGPGNIIETSANGRVEIIINRETVIRCRENSRICLDSLRNTQIAAEKTKAVFSAGKIWTKMKKFSDRIRRFECELPLAIAGVHGTVYEVIVNQDSSSEVKVYNGEVSLSGLNRSSAPSQVQAPTEVNGPHETSAPHEVSIDTWTQIIQSMQKVTIDKSGKPSPAQDFSTDKPDSWEQWNMERDMRINEIFGE